MLRDSGGTPRHYLPPKSRPLYEQVALLQRIGVARAVPLLMTWDEIAAEEGIPSRTLQYFYKSALDGPRAPSTGRPGRRRTRHLTRLLNL
jgi:hypothetical protein